MNAVDYHGNTPLLKCVLQDSRDTVRKLLSSKAAIERHLLDLSIQNMYGRNVIHYLVLNRDKHNLRLVLNILEDSKDALNAVDSYNMSPLMYCLVKDYQEEASMIINHPKAQSRLKLDNADAQGRTLMHVAAEKGNFSFWSTLTKMKNCNMYVRDDDGNTPLMLAAITKQNKVIKSWLESQQNKPTDIRQMAVQNSKGHNLFMLVIMHLETEVIQKFVKTVDLGTCIDQRDKEGNNALLIAAESSQWEVLKSILTNNKLEDLAIDIHPRNKEEYTTLVLVLAATVKISRQIQNYKMKSDKVNEKKMEEELEHLWSLVKLLLEKERDMHGSSPSSGKDAGIECINKQLEWHRQIKSPLPEDVINEFSKLYMVKIKAKKKPEPVPDIPKEEPKKVMPVSSFQEQMNAIYQQSMESEKKREEQRMEIEKKREEQKQAEIRAKKVLQSDPPKKEKSEEKISNGLKTSQTSESKESNGSNVVGNDDGPSLEDIRASWKKNRKERKVPKVDDFDLNSVFTDIMKKAEEKVTPSHEKPEDKYVSESMNEEIQWALQQKKQQEEDQKVKEVEERPKDTSVSKIETTLVTQKKEVQKEKVSEAENILSLVGIMEKKAEEKRKARIEKDKKVSIEEKKKQEEQDQQELDDAMNEEIRWAYEQKAVMMEEKRKLEEEENARRLKEEQDNKVLQSVAEKYRAKEAAKEKEKEERLQKQMEEKEKLERLQKEAEEKMKKLKEIKPACSQEDEELAKLPRWKREKLLREKSLKEKTPSESPKLEHFNKPSQDDKTSKPSEEAKSLEEPPPEISRNNEIFAKPVIKSQNDQKNNSYRKDKVDADLAERMSEEMMWAEEAKRQSEIEQVKAKEKEDLFQKEEMEKIRLKKIEEEKQMIENLEKIASGKLEIIKSQEVEKTTDKTIPTSNGKNEKTDKFEEWLNQEISQSTNSLSESAALTTPPAPVRRKKASSASVEDQEAPPPVIPNRKSKAVEKEKSPAISTMENGSGVRSVGVCVDIRPGYAHASTQTDPVKTCDMAI